VMGKLSFADSGPPWRNGDHNTMLIILCAGPGGNLISLQKVWARDCGMRRQKTEVVIQKSDAREKLE